MKISLFLMVFIITTFLFSASATDYTINNDLIYIDDSNIYLSACPHTLKESGYVYFNLTSKQYTGNIDFYFGFDEQHCKPISAEVLIDGGWIDISNKFRYIQYYYDEMYNWYYLNKIQICSNTNYTLRSYLEINEISTGGKYGVAVKPSSETLSQSINNGHFYYLDPWYDGNYLYRKRITLTGDTSGAQTDYQLLLNVTYDTDMQADFDDLRFTNDTHQIDAWLESNTTDYALIWVEFPTTPANGIEQKNYYMYYGNNSVESDWNGSLTFPFFDNFSGSILNSQWDDISGTPTVSGGLVLDANDKVRASGYSKLYDCACEFRLKKSSTSAGLWRIGMSNNLVSAGFYTNDSMMFYEYNTADIKVLVSNEGTLTGTDTGMNYAADIYYNYALTWVNGEAKVYVDNVLKDTYTTNVPNEALNPRLDMVVSGATTTVAWYFVRKYVAGPPTYAFGAEEKLPYIPPDPTNLQNTTGGFWINHTWQPGVGNVTDSYNISVNNVWHNETINAYWNITYPYSNNSWQNITIWAYNNTNIGSFSINSISQNTQLFFTNLPTNLQETHDHTWINWTWGESFFGTHIIDSYNVSINSTWNNSTIYPHYDHSNLTYELTSSIIIYGYNNTQGLSIYYISDNYTFPIKNKMVKAIEQLVTPIQIIADKFFNIIPFIISIILFAGFGLATMVMTSRLKKW